MKRFLLPLAVSLLAAAASSAAAKPLTVVELFQSQGCSSCPPANANVMALADRADLLTLSFAVTYWDDLGWKDTFASPRFTDRQWDYAHAFHRRQVFTPEVVVNGRADVVGQDRAELDALIHREAPSGGPDIAIAPDAVAIGADKISHSLDVLLVRFDPRVIQVPVARGENAGRTLPHRNVVRSLTRLGAWNGTPARFVLPPEENGLRTAILLQAGPGGPILAAARD